VLVYDPRTVSDAELPTSVHDLTAERWAGAVGIAPTNASFQAFVTAMRVSEGESAATAWLDDMAANDAQAYESNTLILDAVDAGEIQLGLINHYYYYELADEVGEENINARLTFLAPGDPGSLVNAAGVGILDEDNPVAAEFAEYLLTEEAQRYVVDTNAEYPLVDSVDARPGLPPLESLKGAGVPLDDLDDLAGTLALLTETGWI
jgi:iron(III) transport system substrate-binding protein